MKDLDKRFPAYSALLKLYPKTYREHFGQQILQTIADMLDHSPTRTARLAVWTHVAAELPINVAKQQTGYIGGIYMKETPRYLKTLSIVSGLLLVPFVAALVANSLDKVINNHTLYTSWLWKMPVLGVWVLYLPATALLLAIGGYAYYITQYKKTSWLRRLLDVKHSWPILIPGLCAFGVLFILAFHDSAHCWVQTPSHLVTHINMTWKCTTNGFLGGR